MASRVRRSPSTCAHVIAKPVEFVLIAGQYLSPLALLNFSRSIRFASRSACRRSVARNCISAFVRPRPLNADHRRTLLARLGERLGECVGPMSPIPRAGRCRRTVASVRNRIPVRAGTCASARQKGRARRGFFVCLVKFWCYAPRAMVSEALTRANQHFATGTIHHLKPSIEAVN